MNVGLLSLSNSREVFLLVVQFSPCQYLPSNAPCRSYQKGKGQSLGTFEKINIFLRTRGALHRKARSVSRSYLNRSSSPLSTPEMQQSVRQYRVPWLELRPEWNVGILKKGRSRFML
jgi:hypothetical protein